MDWIRFARLVVPVIEQILYSAFNNGALSAVGCSIATITPRVIDVILDEVDEKQFKTSKPCGFVWQ